MNKTMKITMGMALVASALTPHAVFAAKASEYKEAIALDGFYKKSTNEFYDRVAFRALKLEKKRAISKDPEFLFVINRQVYGSKAIIANNKELKKAYKQQVEFEGVFDVTFTDDGRILDNDYDAFPKMPTVTELDVTTNNGTQAVEIQATLSNVPKGLTATVTITPEVSLGLKDLVFENVTIIDDGKLSLNVGGLPSGKHTVTITVAGFSQVATLDVSFADVLTPIVSRIETLSANQITVTFSKQVDPMKAVFLVKRGMLTEEVSVMWNAAKTIATLTKVGNFTPADYTVAVAGIEGLQQVTGTLKIEAGTNAENPPSTSPGTNPPNTLPETNPPSTLPPSTPPVMLPPDTSSAPTYSIDSIDPVYKGLLSKELVGEIGDSGDQATLVTNLDKERAIASGYAEKVSIYEVAANEEKIAVPSSAIVGSPVITQATATDGQVDVFEYNGEFYIYTKKAFIPTDFGDEENLQANITFNVKSGDTTTPISQTITIVKEERIAVEVQFKSAAPGATNAIDVEKFDVTDTTYYSETGTAFIWITDQFGGYLSTVGNALSSLEIEIVSGITGAQNDTVNSNSAGQITISDVQNDNEFTANPAVVRIVASSGALSDSIEVTITKDNSVRIAALGKTIDEANILLKDALEGTDIGNYAVGSKDTLQTAIGTAQAINADASSKTEMQLTDAKSALDLAIANFEYGKVLDKNALIILLEAKIDSVIIAQFASDFGVEYIQDSEKKQRLLDLLSEVESALLNAKSVIADSDNKTAQEIKEAEQTLTEATDRLIVEGTLFNLQSESEYIMNDLAPNYEGLIEQQLITIMKNYVPTLEQAISNAFLALNNVINEPGEDLSEVKNMTEKISNELDHLYALLDSASNLEDEINKRQEVYDKMVEIDTEEHPVLASIQTVLLAAKTALSGVDNKSATELIEGFASLLEELEAAQEILDQLTEFKQTDAFVSNQSIGNKLIVMFMEGTTYSVFDIEEVDGEDKKNIYTRVVEDGDGNNELEELPEAIEKIEIEVEGRKVIFTFSGNPEIDDTLSLSADIADGEVGYRVYYTATYTEDGWKVLIIPSYS